MPNDATMAVTIAVRVPPDLLEVIDGIVNSRPRIRYAKPLTRSEVARELMALGVEALEPAPSE